MAKPLTIGPVEFKSKKDALQCIREIRDSYRDSERVSPTHTSFLTDLLELHPEAPAKIGAGISFFTVELGAEFKRNRHFVVHRIDGTHTDFSFPSCLDGSNERKDRLTALRQAIKPAVLNFRSTTFANGEVRCPFLLCILVPQNCHVDHAPPLTFLRLVGDWLDDSGITFEQIAISVATDNQLVATMTDPQQASSWIAYHNTHAKLRITSALANLSHAKRG